MSGMTEKRIMEERKQWRIDHPPGFFAKFAKNKDDSQNMMIWETGIPGREGTDWEGAVFSLTIYFSKDFPSKPPVCKFTPPIWHPNVFSDGSICLSILSEDGWRPGLNVKQILLGIQELFTDPNPRSPANPDSSRMYEKKRGDYDRKIREQAAKFTPAV